MRLVPTAGWPFLPITLWRSSRRMCGRRRRPVRQTGRNRFSYKHGASLLDYHRRVDSECCTCGPSIAPAIVRAFPSIRLTANYSPYPDGNVPRQGLYFSYRRVCDQYGIPHINTATLGKAIRLCFPTIKTRRLGVRGNSKYHCASLFFFHQHSPGA